MMANISRKFISVAARVPFLALSIFTFLLVFLLGPVYGNTGSEAAATDNSTLMIVFFDIVIYVVFFASLVFISIWCFHRINVAWKDTSSRINFCRDLILWGVFSLGIAISPLLALGIVKAESSSPSIVFFNVFTSPASLLVSIALLGANIGELIVLKRDEKISLNMFTLLLGIGILALLFSVQLFESINYLANNNTLPTDYPPLVRWCSLGIFVFSCFHSVTSKAIGATLELADPAGVEASDTGSNYNGAVSSTIKTHEIISNTKTVTSKAQKPSSAVKTHTLNKVKGAIPEPRIMSPENVENGKSEAGKEEAVKEKPTPLKEDMN